MRIAQITDIQELAGGIEQYVLNLAVAQKARGDSPVLIAPKSGALTAACDKHGIEVAIERDVFDRLRRIRRVIDDGFVDNIYDQTKDGLYDSVIDDLCWLFTKLNIEVIHCHTPPLGVAAFAAGNRVGIPCVCTQHMEGRVKVSNLRFSVICVNRDAVERLKKDGFPGEQLYYVPHGTKVMPRATSEPSRPNLIWAGRLEFVKGPDIAVLAMAELKRRHGSSNCPVLNVYGGGSSEGYLKEMVSVLSLEDMVRFHGAQLNILDRCPASDILVISSRGETGPLVALEAMSRGMPIVAFPVGDIAEMVPDQRFGYVVRNGSITALADGIDSMLSDIHAGRFDPEVPISRHLAHYSLEKMTERVDEVYKCVTGRSRDAKRD